MEITYNQQSEQCFTLHIHLTPEDYMPRAEKSLRKLNKEVAFKGFRKGTVPPDLVRRTYGSQVMADELNKMADNTFSTYIKDNNIDVFLRPVPIAQEDNPAVNINKPQPYNFAFDVCRQPKVALANPVEQGITFNQYHIQASETELDNYITNLRKQHGTDQDVEHITADSFIEVDITPLDETGTRHPEGETISNFIAIDMLKDEYAQQLIGLAVNTTINLPLLNAYKDREPAQVRDIIFRNTTNEAIANATQFQISVKRIIAIVPADMNRAFFERVLGSFTLAQDEATFRQEIQQNFDNSYKESADAYLKRSIWEYLEKNTSIAFDDEFLVKYLQNYYDKFDADKQEAILQDFKKSLSTNIIINDYFHQLELEKITDDELFDFAMEDVINTVSKQNPWIMQQLNYQMFIPLAKKWLSDESYRNRVVNTLAENKVLSALSEKVAKEEVPISAEEFQKLSS